jgi:hypothetical protein
MIYINVEIINELLWVFVIVAIGICVGFIIFILNHEKQRKKEIREAGNNDGGIGRHDKFVHDESSRTSTTPASSTKTTKT